VEPKLVVEEELVVDELDVLEEEEDDDDDELLEFVPGVLDEDVGGRLLFTREVAERNACEPPPVCKPLVDVTEGVVAEEPVVPVVEESELPLDDDIPPPPPRELDWSTMLPPPLPPPPFRKLPPRPLPLRFPRNWGLIREANLSAPVVPVSRIVRCKRPCVTVPVRIAAAAAASGVVRTFV
jgi:hypothetical protein